jgi:hypothetical protein
MVLQFLLDERNSADKLAILVLLVFLVAYISPNQEGMLEQLIINIESHIDLLVTILKNIVNIISYLQDHLQIAVVVLFLKQDLSTH